MQETALCCLLFSVTFSKGDFLMSMGSKGRIGERGNKKWPNERKMLTNPEGRAEASRKDLW